MRVLLLGAPRPLTANRWKDDIAESGQTLGWQVNHVPANAVTTGQVVDLARGCDLLLWARTHRHDPDGDITTMLRKVEAAGTVTVGLHLDLYWGVARREAEIGQHPWWSCQWVFTADGGPRPWASRGVNHHWLPPAVGPRFLGRLYPSSQYMAHRVAFVGGFVRDIHGPHRGQLLAYAQRRWQDRFGRYGQANSQVWGERLSMLCATVRAVVGDSAPAPFYWSDRVPVIMSRGGVLAHPRTQGFGELGITDETAILYDRFDFVTMGARIDSMTDPELAAMSDAAVQTVRDRHLWTHRLTYIADLVGLS